MSVGLSKGKYRAPRWEDGRRGWGALWAGHGDHGTNMKLDGVRKPSPTHPAVLSAGLRAASSSQEERSRGPLKMEGGRGWGTCKRESNDCICHSDDHRQRPSLGGCPTELDGRALRANVVPIAGTWCRGFGGRRRGRAGQCSHHPSGLAASLSLWSPAYTPPPLVRP